VRASARTRQLFRAIRTAKLPEVALSRGIPARPGRSCGHVAGVRTLSAKKTWSEWPRGNDVARQDAALHFRQVGSDRHIGVRHRAEHRLHGGRMPLHPFQPFGRINGERARRLLDAGAVDRSGRGSHCVCERPPGFLLARFGRDFRLEISEFHGEQSAPFRARRAVVLRRRISPSVHGAKTPKSCAGKSDNDNCGSRRPS
jgi:hypothetical protein